MLQGATKGTSTKRPGMCCTHPHTHTHPRPHTRLEWIWKPAGNIWAPPLMSSCSVNLKFKHVPSLLLTKQRPPRWELSPLRCTYNVFCMSRCMSVVSVNEPQITQVWSSLCHQEISHLRWLQRLIQSARCPLHLTVFQINPRKRPKSSLN